MKELLFVFSIVEGGWIWLMMFKGCSAYLRITLPDFSKPVTSTLTISPILFLLSLIFLMLSSSLMTPDMPRFRLQKTILFWIFLMKARIYVCTFSEFMSVIFLFMNPYAMHFRVSDRILWYSFVVH